MYDSVKFQRRSSWGEKMFANRNVFFYFSVFFFFFFSSIRRVDVSRFLTSSVSNREVTRRSNHEVVSTICLWVKTLGQTFSFRVLNIHFHLRSCLGADSAIYEKYSSVRGTSDLYLLSWWSLFVEFITRKSSSTLKLLPDNNIRAWNLQS